MTLLLLALLATAPHDIGDPAPVPCAYMESPGDVDVDPPPVCWMGQAT